MWCVITVLCFCLNLINGLSFYGFGNEFEYVVKRVNKTRAKIDSVAVNTSWIEQPLDHFNSEDTRKWNMRYFERLDLWKPDGAIFLYLGGEGPAKKVFLKTGLMYKLAKETNGALIFAEHRYYGESKPFANFTTENLKYLSSRQALADFAKLLQSLRSMPKYKSSKIVTVGGSYSGNLAAWIKELYPDLVDASIASSAPVLAKINFKEYLEIVGDIYRIYGSRECREQIQFMFTEFERYFTSKKGIEILKEDNNICDYCDMSKSENQALFFKDKASEFSRRVQYGTPEVVKRYCDSNFTSSFRSKREEKNIFWNKSSQCYSYEFNEMITSIKSIDQKTAWTYQTCTEFGFFQTSSSINQPFTNNIPLKLYYNTCKQLFGPDFDRNRIERGVKETNEIYGGLNPNTSNVVFINGDMDPWSVLSVLEDISSDVLASVITISGTSHGRDLFPDKSYDPEELTEARSYIRFLTQSWIENKQENNSEENNIEQNNNEENTADNMSPLRKRLASIINKARERRLRRREKRRGN